MTPEFLGRFRFRVPCNEHRVRVRAYYRFKNGQDESAVENWLAAEAEEMAVAFADPWALFPLSRELDQAFLALYRQWALGAATLRPGAVDWQHFWGAAERFLDAVADRPDAAGIVDRFFGNFTGIWQTLLDAERFAEADGFWERAVDGVVAWEKRSGKRVHKGAGFFFWGANQLLGGDLLRGFTLIHESLREDSVTHAKPVADTPSTAVATLDHQHAGLRAPLQRWLSDLATDLELRIRGSGSSLSLHDLQRRFLAAPVDWSRTFSFVYTFATLQRLHRHPADYRNSDFAGQAALGLFFDLAVVLECAIGDRDTTRYPPRRHPTFVDRAAFLLDRLGSVDARARLGQVHREFSADFAGPLGRLLDKRFTLDDGTSPTPQERALFIAYGIRNHRAHDTRSAAVVWRSFDAVLDQLLAALLLSVETLY